MDESEIPFLKVSRSKCQSVSIAFHLRTAHTCDMHHNPYENLVIGPAVLWTENKFIPVCKNSDCVMINCIHY